MKDNGKTEAVKNCTTCRHIDKLGKGLPCSECRMSYPPADADDYNLMWELRETLAEVKETREFKPGETVMYGDKECTVLSVCHKDDDVLLELLKVEVDSGYSGEFTMTRIMVPAICCAKAVKELTAKEYAEKLREYFGKPEIGELDIKDCFCSTRDCPGCAFDAEPSCCTAAVVMFDPERALQMIQEAENRDKRDKPKGKTYREDFFEKFPNADRTAAGLPMPCRNKLYFAAAPCSANPRYNCDDCWNEVMPEEEK